MIRREGRAARSSRSQQGPGPRSHPWRATIKVAPTDDDGLLLG